MVSSSFLFFYKNRASHILGPVNTDLTAPKTSNKKRKEDDTIQDAAAVASVALAVTESDKGNVKLNNLLKLIRQYSKLLTTW
jgi:hypothetical protein